MFGFADWSRPFAIPYNMAWRHRHVAGGADPGQSSAGTRQASRLQVQLFDFALPRPIVGIRDEPRAHRIVAHVVPFLVVAFEGS
jgi:hypothetical protein